LPKRADSTEASVLALAGCDHTGADHTGLAEWVTQLVAGGLGKAGRGPLPVLVEGESAPEWTRPDALTVKIGGAIGGAIGGDAGVPGAAVATLGPTAAQVLHWQYAVAVAAHLLGVDPTDRPDASSPAAPGPDLGDAPAFTEGGVEVRGGPWLTAGTATVADALRALVGVRAGDSAYLAVHAYLDRGDDASAAVLRPELARRTGLPTMFGWAPRCLPGAAQYAAGGPQGALICQLTGAAGDADDPTDPHLDAALAQLQLAQARADAAAFAARGRPVLRLHFTDRLAGLVTLARAVQLL
jgi:glucose-6-phosphate isomerase